MKACDLFDDRLAALAALHRDSQVLLQIGESSRTCRQCVLDLFVVDVRARADYHVQSSLRRLRTILTRRQEDLEFCAEQGEPAPTKYASGLALFRVPQRLTPDFINP